MRADIRLDGPHNGSLQLDGTDISRAVRGFALNVSVGEFPRLTLDLLLIEDTRMSGEVEVIIPAEVRELLMRLGWVPPKS